jgi:hypothetical protein
MNYYGKEIPDKSLVRANIEVGRSKRINIIGRIVAR